MKHTTKSENIGSTDTILRGRLFPPLIKFTLPLMLAILIQALYGAVDLMVIGQFGSTAGVAAVSNGSQIMHTVTGVITGLTMGVTVLVGNCIGADDKKGAGDIVGGMIALFVIAAAVLMAVMLFFAEQIAVLMQVPEEAVEGTVSYLRICGTGLIFIVAFNAISGLFRGVGDSRSPLLFITIACFINVLGDLLLIGVFKLDVAGAAIATVFAQAVSVVFSVVKISRGALPFPVKKENFTRPFPVAGKIFKVGAPIAMQELLVSISFLIIMAIINSISLTASAAIGIAEKMFLFLSIVPMSFTSSLSAFVAQNIGAKQEPRALQAVKLASAISFVIGIGMAALTYFGGDILASTFEKDPQVIAATHEYLRGAGAEYMIIPITFCLLGYFNGIGKTGFVMMEGLLSSFLVRIPLSFYFSRLPDTNLFTIALAVPISAIFSLVLTGTYFAVTMRKRKRLPDFRQ